MKKLLFFLLLCSAFTLMLFEKTGETEAESSYYPEPGISPYGKVNDYSQVSFSVLGDSDIPNKLKIKLCYWGTEALLYREGVILEKKIDGEWNTLALKDEAEKEMPQWNLLKSLENKLWTYNLEEVYGDLSDGIYRVVVSVVPINEGVSEGVYYLTDSFTIGFAIEETPFEEVNTLNTAMMTMADDGVTPTTMSVVFEYNGEYEMFYDDTYWLEVRQDGKWYTIATVGNGIGNIIINEGFLYGIKFGENSLKKYNWLIRYGELQTGNYRLVTKVFEAEQTGDKKEYYLAIEFEIKN